MSKVIKTQIKIKASAERVWQILTDFPSYPQWNPFLVEVSGELVVGAKLTVVSLKPNGKPYTFYPKVTQVEPNKGFAWLDHLWAIPCLMDGNHSFTIEPAGDGEVQFGNGEVFTGLFVPIVSCILQKSAPSYEAMDVALKRRAEHGTMVAGANESNANDGT